MRLATTSLVTLVLCVFGVAAYATTGNDPCRPNYILPYTEQCDFDYRSIAKDQSVANVNASYHACMLAHDSSIACVKTPNKRMHAIATSALYRNITQLAEIALFTQHYALAQGLLGEKGDVLRILEHDGKPGDPAFAAQRASIATDLANVKAGECTLAAFEHAAQQSTLAHTRRYGDLATLLAQKAQDYARCAPLATTADKAAYIRYQGLVAFEESGRAAQAGGDKKRANRTYADCLSQTNAVMRDASAPVRSLLGTVHDLCKGRMLGRFPVDKPHPLDAPDGKGFEPVAVPRS